MDPCKHHEEVDAGLLVVEGHPLLEVVELGTRSEKFVSNSIPTVGRVMTIYSATRP